jgi:hypothetical protein
MNKKSSLVHDVLQLNKSSFSRLQQEVGVTFSQGHHESTEDFRIRVLTEVEKAGKMRLIEEIIND